MNCEQKYNEALERARTEYEKHESLFNGFHEMLSYIFPELKESEDEKIRKTLIRFFNDQYSNETKMYDGTVTVGKALAWLEKQGDKDKLIQELGKYKVKYTQEVLEQHINSMGNKENEKIRKSIIGFLITISSLKDGKTVSNEDFDSKAILEWIAWLEKQGEQTSLQTNERAWLYLVSDVLTWKDGIGQYLDDPRVQELAKKLCSEYAQKLYNSAQDVTLGQKTANNVEPKFKVGDWITDGNITIQIEAIKNNCYLYCGDCALYSIKTADKVYHLWTIADAKDGDILCTYECDEPKIVFILKGTSKKHCALSYYCYYNIMYPHFNSGSEKGCLAPNDEDVKPASKKQCDLLFEKIEEAGYEWNSDKKELTRRI